MNYYFITGTSRGIGQALAEALLEKTESKVYGFARSNSIQHERYTHVTMDLAELSQVKSWKFPAVTDADRIVLVNNAGMLGNVKYAGGLDTAAVINAFHVNLVAPTILTNNFLAAYAEKKIELVILNVSSGAAVNPIDGWSIYCASKAGLDHFSRTVAVEMKEAGLEHVHIFSIAPGIVDTAMQTKIRNASELDFSKLQQFRNYKETGQLLDPRLVALKFIAILANPKKYRETVFSLKEVS